MTLPPIHLRKKRLPNTLPPKVQETLKVIIVAEAKRRRIFAEHEGRIPMEDIFVDPSGLVLFRNPATGGWVTKATSREEVS